MSRLRRQGDRRGLDNLRERFGFSLRRAGVALTFTKSLCRCPARFLALPFRFLLAIRNLLQNDDADGWFASGSTVWLNKVMDTYSKHAAICGRFYDLTLEAEEVGRFVFRNSWAEKGGRALFVGGMFEVAKELVKHGLMLDAVDYTDEMVEIGRRKLPGARVERADLRRLPGEAEYDLLFVIGRVFTHMVSDEDLHAALRSCRTVLRPGGRLFFDNYEDTKIRETGYFNGLVACADHQTSIERRSLTELVSEKPYVVRWSAQYTGIFEGREFSFADSMLHRAFSRAEIATLLPQFGFKLLGQGDNFDETSFYTRAEAF